MPPANAGRPGAAMTLAVRLNSRMLCRAFTMLVRSLAGKIWPPLLSAMHLRRGSFGFEFIAMTYTVTPVTRPCLRHRDELESERSAPQVHRRQQRRPDL